MSKTITVSDETYKKIQSQLGKDKIKEKKKVGIEIKTLAGSVLFKSSKTTVKGAVEDAVDEGANLKGAYLEGANLKGAYLEGAYLEGANLKGAYLEGANFYNAKFYGRGGNLKIKKNQLDDFLKALGIVVED